MIMIMNNVDRAAEVRKAGLTDTLHDLIEMMEADGWARRWPGHTTLADDYGNVVHLTINADELAVAVEYAMTESVETLSLDPCGDTARAAKIIFAACAPLDD